MVICNTPEFATRRRTWPGEHGRANRKANGKAYEQHSRHGLAAQPHASMVEQRQEESFVDGMTLADVTFSSTNGKDMLAHEDGRGQ